MTVPDQGLPVFGRLIISFAAGEFHQAEQRTTNQKQSSSHRRSTDYGRECTRSPLFGVRPCPVAFSFELSQVFPCSSPVTCSHVTSVKPLMLRAAIFDLDGVLADSEPWWNQIDAKLLSEYGVKYGG